jgi:hypothetical protein
VVYDGTNVEQFRDTFLLRDYGIQTAAATTKTKAFNGQSGASVGADAG